MQRSKDSSSRHSSHRTDSNSKNRHSRDKPRHSDSEEEDRTNQQELLNQKRQRRSSNSSEENNSEEISLFPNPAKDVLKVHSPGIIFNISILNILGSVELESIPNATSCNLDLSGFDSGIYFVRIQTSNGTLTKKIQVQK